MQIASQGVVFLDILHVFFLNKLNYILAMRATWLMLHEWSGRGEFAVWENDGTVRQLAGEFNYSQQQNQSICTISIFITGSCHVYM